MSIPKKYSNFLVGLLMAFFMSMVMSFGMLVINAGWHDGILWTWLSRAWPLAFILAYGSLSIIRPLVTRLVAAVTR